MAVDKLVDSTQLDSDLTSVANAIRTKGGTTAQLAFPTGFVSAIEGISAGGDYVADDWFDFTKPVGAVSSDKTSLMTYTFNARTGITSISVPNATSIPNNFAQNASNLTSIYAPAATSAAGASLGYTKIQYLVLPSLNAISAANAFSHITSMVGADFGGTTSISDTKLQNYTFESNSSLRYLVLRGSFVWALTNINALGNTRFASGKAGGILYVPNDQITAYQAASNWSTILGYTNNQIKSIESTASDPDAPVDLTTHYIDGSLIRTP